MEYPIFVDERRTRSKSRLIVPDLSNKRLRSQAEADAHPWCFSCARRPWSHTTLRPCGVSQIYPQVNTETTRCYCCYCRVLPRAGKRGSSLRPRVSRSIAWLISLCVRPPERCLKRSDDPVRANNLVLLKPLATCTPRGTRVVRQNLREERV